MSKVATLTEEQQAELHLWADWLDETELPQGKGVLKKKAGGTGEVCYCCLGLYIEMKSPELYTEEVDNDGRYRCPIDLYDDKEENTHPNVVVLPLQMKKALGIDQVMMNSRTFESALTSLNDMFEYDFKQIAVEVRHFADHGKFTALTERKFKVN